MQAQHEKKRVLIPIVGQGSITHVIRTGMLDQLSEVITPVITIFWNEKKLVAELEAKGLEVHIFPEYKTTSSYSNHRNKINLWYKKYRLNTPSVKIQERYLEQFGDKSKRRFIRTLRKLYYETRFAVQPRFADQLIEQEKQLITGEPAFNTFSKWVDSLKLDGMFTVTPFLPEVDLVARILRNQEKQLVASIHSFDNVTKRGWQSTVFDHYLVWNKYNKAELQRIHPSLAGNDKITIAGAPQFDFHFNETYSWTNEVWRERLGLPTGKKIILYAGGPVSLLPDEPQYLVALKQAFEENKLPNDAVVLFRCHPLDRVERWKEAVRDSPFIFYDTAPNGVEKLDYANVQVDDIVKLVSTLKHADVHINVVSTMTVDGSAFQKPQIGPYYDEVNPANAELFRRMYQQEHYVPILKTKVVQLAHTRQAYITLVNDALLNPAAFTANCTKCLEEIITYTDGRSTERAVATIKKFFAG